MKVVAAVGELESEYSDRVEFTVVGAEITSAGIGERIFGDAQHGLLGIDTEGNAQVTIPGHRFGTDEIVDAIDTLTAGS